MQRVWLPLILGLASVTMAIISIPIKRSDLVIRRSATENDGILDCLQMESRPGQFRFQAAGDGARVCGLYLIGPEDTAIEMDFPEFHIDCEDGGLMAIVDGWELNGEFFPSMADHPDDFEDRYHGFCGPSRPARVYLARQNVALVQFRVPHHGQGFTVNVRFSPHPQPCNIMAYAKEGVLTIRNFGLRRNCSVSMIYPENILLLNVNVGATYKGTSLELETGLSTQCSSPDGADFVELLYGLGLDTNLMTRKMAFCGLRSKSARRAVTLGCQNSAVRLVSSGQFFNAVTFRYSQPSPLDLEALGPSQC